MFIATWLRQLELSQYVDAFVSNDIDEAVLCELTDSDLRELGIRSLGHRKKLLAAIQKLATIGASTLPLNNLPGEHRQVTVLFADISGFVALSHQLGAEATHALLTQYFQAVDAIIARFGGWVDKHIGDNVMGIFGAPIAHKDDPRRAVLAAFAIRQAVATLTHQLAQTINVHIGIASGQVVASRTGSDVHFEYTVIGAAVNLAARLQGLAQGAEIILDEVTRQAVGESLQATAEDDVAIKGLPHAIRIWRAQSVAPTRLAKDASLLVGRQTEQASFADALQTCVNTFKGQTLYVRGEAGIGKSRLVQQFKQQAIAQGLQVHQAEVLDFGQGQGDIWRELTASLLSIPNATPLATRQAAIDTVIREGYLDKSRQLYLNALLNIPQPPDLQVLYELLDNRTRQIETVQTVVNLMAARSRHEPILVIIEDIHWLDDLTLEHLSRLVNAVADCPWLLVLTSRTESNPIDADWLATASLNTWSDLILKPLPLEDATTIAASYPQLMPVFIETCIHRAEGNPFFLKQLLQAGEEVVGDVLPGTVQSVVLARVDGLDIANKQILKAASVLGRRFSSDALQHVLSDRLFDLKTLIDNCLIEADGEDYRFAHALIREGVYSSLLTPDRHTFHRRAAAWFERLDPELWAVHLDCAADSQAVAAYEVAAQHHLSQFRYSRALPLVERGLVLAPAASTYELIQLKAKISRALGDAKAAIALHRQAAAIATTLLEKADALIGVAACVRMSGGYQEGVDALTQAKRAAVGPNAERALSQIHYFQGCFCYSAGDLEGCLAANTQALDYAQQVKDPELIARALSNLADAYYARCQMHTAFDCYERCIRMAQAHRLGQVEIANRAQLAVMYRYLHDLSQAIANIQKTIAMARQIGELRTLMYALDTQGEFLAEQGNLEAAQASLAEAHELSERLGNHRYRAYIMQRQARVWIEQGYLSHTRSILEAALAICRDTDMRFVSPRVLGLLARVAVDDEERLRFLAEGQQVLSQGCISHNFLWYYYDAMEACLQATDWDRANHYATALEHYAATEPFPRSQFWVARCRSLAAMGQGTNDEQVAQTLQQLYTDAQTAGLWLGRDEIAHALDTLHIET